jgi:hypothetical protein
MQLRCHAGRVVQIVVMMGCYDLHVCMRQGKAGKYSDTLLLLPTSSPCQMRGISVTGSRYIGIEYYRYSLISLSAVYTAVQYYVYCL